MGKKGKQIGYFWFPASGKKNVCGKETGDTVWRESITVEHGVLSLGLTQQVGTVSDGHWQVRQAAPLFVWIHFLGPHFPPCLLSVLH